MASLSLAREMLSLLAHFRPPLRAIQIQRGNFLIGETFFIVTNRYGDIHGDDRIIREERLSGRLMLIIVPW